MKLPTLMIRLVPACAALLLLGSGAAQAAPFTFEFDMPAWTFTQDASIFGSSAVLDLTFDNGAVTDLNQTYLNSDVTSVSITAVGGTFSDTWTPFTSNNFFTGLPGISFVSTDASGIATLDLLADPVGGNSINAFNDAGRFQLGIITPTGGLTTFAVLDANFVAGILAPQADGAFTGLKLTSTPTAVPEPGTLALMGLGIAGLGFALRRKPTPTA